MAQKPIKLTFDRERKLVARHQYVRDAVLASKRPVLELLADPFGGHPYLVQALLIPSAKEDEGISLNKASELIDKFFEHGGTFELLRDSMAKVLSAYMNIEVTPTADEGEGDAAPNAATPVAPGRSDA